MKINKILSIAGLALSITGTIISSIASDKAMEVKIAKEVTKHLTKQ